MSANRDDWRKDYMAKPLVAITMGDAAGIGPEIIVKALSRQDVYGWCNPAVLGDAEVMKFALSQTGSNLKINIVSDVKDGLFKYGIIDMLDYGNIDMGALKLGVVDPMCGKAAVFYVLEAGKMALNHQVDATVSAPLNKESMRKAGYNYEGQTQILGELTGSKRYGMILILGDIRLMLLSTHVSLRKAIDLVKRAKVLEMIELANESLGFFGIKNPRIAVAGLNPHAGEGGLFGGEEVDEIIPAMNDARQRGVNVMGPVPADTVFVRAKQKEFDITIAMYHDQGTMATKLLGFGEVVTVLAGLPIIRTSVGHGTAFDIAGKNRADPNNFIEAIRVAAELARTRKSTQNTGVGHGAG
jgi:4-hydroxythreonine-4-phosphate dehydrogenase